MDMHLATEVAYTNGFRDGKKAAAHSLWYEVQELAKSSAVNQNEPDYRNLMLSLSDFEDIVKKFL